MKISEAVILQERLSNLDETGKEYLSMTLNKLPKFPKSLLISFTKIITYIILISFGYYTFQSHKEMQLLFTILISLPFFIEAITCLAIWDSWNAFYKESQKQSPNYKEITKYCIDTPTNSIKIFLLATMATIIFNGVMVLIDGGIFYSLLSSSLLLILSYVKGNQCLLKIRFLVFISTDISQYKVDK